LKLRGFPALYREKAEFLEVGPISTFSVTKLIGSIRRFANINQRWGI